MRWSRLVPVPIVPLLVVGRVLQLSPGPIAATDNTSLQSGAISRLPRPPEIATGATLVADPKSEEWQTYVCRGEKLLQAMTNKKDKAIDFMVPIESPFDGTLEDDLKRWGYIERNEDAEDQCMFDKYLRGPLEALSINPKGSIHGGPNHCYFFQHHDPRMKDEQGYLVPVHKQTYEVDGRIYRATQAKAVVGANPESGVIYFLDVTSAGEGAKQAWGLQTRPPTDQLPKLKQISDMAWGAWRRVHAGDEGLNDINLFLVHDIRNKITQRLVAEALKSYVVLGDQKRATSLPVWPGLTFSIDTEEGAAMLGSPNGIAVGYFLAQHKDQLRDNKYTDKVQLWTEWEGYNPSMIFHVTDAKGES